MSGKRGSSWGRFWCAHWRVLVRTGLIVLLTLTVVLVVGGRVHTADGRADAEVPQVIAHPALTVDGVYPSTPSSSAVNGARGSAAA